jgi:hypothetical protein
MKVLTFNIKPGPQGPNWDILIGPPCFPNPSQSTISSHVHLRGLMCFNEVWMVSTVDQVGHPTKNVCQKTFFKYHRNTFNTLRTEVS